MDKKLISKLLDERMRRDGLSTRDVAKVTGVAHTTIMRVLQGKNIAVDTLQRVARFLGTDPGGFVAIAEERTTDAIAKDLATIIGENQSLANVLADAVENMKKGRVSAELVKECVRYIAWRLSDLGEGKEPKPEENIDIMLT